MNWKSCLFPTTVTLTAACWVWRASNDARVVQVAVVLSALALCAWANSLVPTRDEQAKQHGVTDAANDRQVPFD